MAGKKVPVTVSHETWNRLDGLLRAVETRITATASRAVDRSTICHQAIRDLLDKYENDPAALAARLGLSTRTVK